MLYASTRGYYGPLPAAEAIKLGIAPDGGLFVPTERVHLSMNEIAAMVSQTYQERAVKILGPYLTGFTAEEIRSFVTAAYNTASFDHPDIAPLTDLDAKLSVLELWHGPTCAFKDMALQMLPHLLVKSMEKTGESADILILVATSGDTGKAALEGFKDVPHTAIMVFYPENGVSEIQKAQMVTQEGGNVGVYAVRGNFDDTQSSVKAIFGDAVIQQSVAERGFKFSSANSINWGRLLPQIVYYFSAYADLLARRRVQPGEAINFVVPTGNFGNILAGFYAKQMGLPVHRLVCAANENNVLTDFIAGGTYNRNRDFKRTISPSMDILISSNLERLLYELSNQDADRVQQWMADLDVKGCYTVDNATLEKVQSVFWSDYAGDSATMLAIKETYQRYGYVVDTHTAVGLYVYNRYRQSTGDDRLTVVLSTASPFKFNASVASALMGEEQTAGRDEFALLQLLSDFSGLPVPSGLSGLAGRPVRHNTVVEREQMPEAVLDFVKKRR